MKKSFLLFLLLVGCSFLVQAQAPTPASPIKAMVVQNGRYSKVLYTRNDEPLTTATLKALLKTYPPSADELRKHRAQNRLALTTIPVFAAALVIGGLHADRQKDVPGSAFSKAPVAFSISIGALFGGAFIGGSNTHIAKAIEAYNSQFK